MSDYLKFVATTQAQLALPVDSADELDRLIDDEASADVTLGGTLSRADIYDGHD